VNRAEQEILVEQVAGAHRDRDPLLRLKPHRAFFDLDAAGREEAFDAALELRKLEAALDPEGLSTTAHAVLARIQAR
jgi:hypothetical protein